jgi:tripartite-type tricarboxylate transporter receptor subunit TctC
MQPITLRLLPGMLALMLAASPALAQSPGANYPSRTITIIAPFAPGGPVDVESRIYSKKLTEMTGQKVVVDYKPGANSSIGGAYVARATPDGYTLLVGTAGLPLIPTQYKDLPYDILKDLAPLSQMSERTSVLLMRPGFPARNFKEYAAYSRANPEKVSYGYSSGSSQLVGAWLHNLAKLKVTFIGYKGVGAATADLMSDRLDLLSSTLAVSLPMMKSGKARGLVILGMRRSKLVPDLQTVPEQGLPEFDFAGNWFGFLAPGATPPDVINKLVELLVSMAHAPDVVAQLEAQGSTAIGSKPPEFRKLIATEVVRWAKVAKDSGIELGD